MCITADKYPKTKASEMMNFSEVLKKIPTPQINLPNVQLPTFGKDTNLGKAPLNMTRVRSSYYFICFMFSSEYKLFCILSRNKYLKF